ncbi:hypothetical protein C8035_v003259 [Colletotrichum spinosum]|uniref:Uncharacterized protein n=1 Tax=Colletotrichum spinosum TaxID=1347390 RepID=A0A4R8Q4T1_9PEZI|nr:hypothetical protein C8035_v003259 [Colletotrichum spinosum]
MPLREDVAEDAKFGSRVEHLEDPKPDQQDKHVHVGGNALLVNKDGGFVRFLFLQQNPTTLSTSARGRSTALFSATADFAAWDCRL